MQGNRTSVNFAGLGIKEAGPPAPEWPLPPGAPDQLDANGRQSEEPRGPAAPRPAWEALLRGRGRGCRSRGGDGCRWLALGPVEAAIGTGRSVSGCRATLASELGHHTPERRLAPCSQLASTKPALSPRHGAARAQSTPGTRNLGSQKPRGWRRPAPAVAQAGLRGSRDPRAGMLSRPGLQWWGEQCPPRRHVASWSCPVCGLHGLVLDAQPLPRTCRDPLEGPPSGPPGIAPLGPAEPTAP